MKLSTVDFKEGIKLFAAKIQSRVTNLPKTFCAKGNRRKDREFDVNFLKQHGIEMDFFERLRFGDNIVNGVEAEVGEFPHMAALGYEAEEENYDFR
jgi:hypothetical protein